MAQARARKKIVLANKAIAEGLEDR